MTKWDEVGRALAELATLDGGPEKLYKPVVQIEYYEHDDCGGVRVGRCKGMNDVVADVGFNVDICYRYIQPEDHEDVHHERLASAILAALKECHEKLTKRE